MIHEANSVPGRANRMFADTASAVTSTFYATAKYLPNAIRTGQPIREELRAVATDREEGKPTVLVLGGSQGSAFLNSTMPSAAALLAPVPNVIHAAGKGNYQEMAKTSQLPPGYRLEPYLETTELVEAYRSATVAVARSGGTLAEFAMFGLPSVLVPLPTSADDHQLVNAREFVDLGGASLVEQKDASPESLSEALRGWLDVPKKRLDASAALRNWDVPDATDRIVDILFSIPPANYPSHA
jgi:UDP-N-acetylglucosamine--N-acetylmuramyl-(pentapeptide) pyrophosphoryl-undecaprenol N-acetylglucosamine transferase